MILPALLLLSVCCQLSVTEEGAQGSSGGSANSGVQWCLVRDFYTSSLLAISKEGLTKGNLSLKLSSLNLTDSGRYKCSFITDNVVKSCYVNLSVGESDVIGSDEPVKANVGQDVILPCHLEPPFNVSTLTVEWTWKPKNTFVHVYRSGRDNPDIPDNQFKGRTSLFHDEMKKGNISLKLRNVRKEDEGLYVCHVPKLHSQVRKGNVTLTVVEAGNDRKQQTDGAKNVSTVLIVCGVFIGIVFAGIAGIIIWIKRQRGERNNQPNNDQEPHPDEQAIPLRSLQPNQDDEH